MEDLTLCVKDGDKSYQIQLGFDQIDVLILIQFDIKTQILELHFELEKETSLDYYADFRDSIIESFRVKGFETVSNDLTRSSTGNHIVELKVNLSRQTSSDANKASKDEKVSS